MSVSLVTGVQTCARPISVMISALFVDRPRLAVVISILITLAGAISMMVIPVAQFPDIVPPQVQVTASYPGPGAEVVEAPVAQTIEGSQERLAGQGCVSKRIALMVTSH